MKLKIDIIKALLAHIENSDEYPEPFFIDSVDSLDVDSVTINYHLFLMLEAGLISGREKANRENRHVIVYRLTWSGHDFLANAQNPTVWKRFKESSRAAGHFSIDVSKLSLSTIAAELVKSVVIGQ